jgi:hypothetical protein
MAESIPIDKLDSDRQIGSDMWGQPPSAVRRARPGKVHQEL